jgi:hypothetical protein
MLIKLIGSVAVVWMSIKGVLLLPPDKPIGKIVIFSFLAFVALVAIWIP